MHLKVTGILVIPKEKVPDGKLTSTPHEAVNHSICISTNYTSWLASISLSEIHDRICLPYADLTQTRPDTRQREKQITGAL
ncbi:hypothetical protein BDP27DRAFT_1320650 [Rhodocollybia butyracea]|uniref:Uncharacterized protein n=1 Tax=Rhodocollybia butyracea TaxID=206335 RepID=A0A9P5Q1A1_9AGAR|nr:hypothetical protein BDP27DRAFT_1320650 [Rhodocollybia butyracea]